MYAWVTQWKIKPGHTSAEALALLNETNKTSTASNVTLRAYTAQTDQGELLIFDEVWPSIEAHDRWWEEYNKTSAHDALFAQWDQVVELYKPTKVWQVTEWRF